jgi:hypothetical protein
VSLKTLYNRLEVYNGARSGEPAAVAAEPDTTPPGSSPIEAEEDQLS